MADAPAAPFDIPCDLLQKGWQIHAIEVEDARKEPAPRSGSASSDFRCRVTAIIFGALTIVSGGRALFGGPDMGAVVSLVLRFNFVAGFAYVLASIGLWRRAEWARALSVGIAAAGLDLPQGRRQAIVLSIKSRNLGNYEASVDDRFGCSGSFSVRVIRRLSACGALVSSIPSRIITLISPRRFVIRVLATLCLAHVLILALVCTLIGASVGTPVLLAALLAAAPLALLVRDRWPCVTSFVTSFAVLYQAALLVQAFNNHPLQPEISIYFVLVLAIVASFCEWRLNLLLPASSARIILPFPLFYQVTRHWPLAAFSAAAFKS